MIKRSVYIVDKCSLSIRNCQLVVLNETTGQIKSIPVEDVGHVVIENQQTSITVPALNALAANNSSVVFCDNRHFPVSMLSSLDGNTIQAERFADQLSASEPLKKNLWKQLVESKIKNQASLLQEKKSSGALLKPYYSNVKSGDSDNREGAAARIYWKALFGPCFTRDFEGEIINKMLDYGYTILRSAVARALIGSGLNPAFGLFHKNRYNAFPLADDVMEPYRPYVDNLVYDLIEKGAEEMSTSVKAELQLIATKDVVINGVMRPLDLALSYTSASLAHCFGQKSKKIVLPEL